MKGLKNFSRVAAVVLGFLILNAAINELYTRAVLSKLLIFKREEQFQDAKDDVSILFLGDSHSESGLWPRYIPNSFNLSNSAENYIQTYYKIAYFLEKEQLGIDLVTLPLDVHEFSSHRVDNFTSPYYWKKYVNYYELGKNKGELFRFLQQRLVGEFRIFNGLDFTVELLVEGAGLGEIEQGFLMRKLDLSQYPNVPGWAASRARYHLEDANYMDPLLFEYFLRMLELLQAHDIYVVLIRFPVTEEYLESVSQYISIEDFYEEVIEILAENGFDYLILDYHDLYYGQYHLFNDPDHLNVSGAELFSLIVRDDLRGLEVIP